MQPLTPLPDWSQEPPATLLQRVEAAGIQGMGGAGYRTAEKLRLARAAQVQRIIANAVECEPGIQVDALLLAEHSAEVALGLRIAMHTVGAAQGVLAYAEDFHQSTQDQIAAHFEPGNGSATEGWQAVAVARGPGAGAERSLCQQLFGLGLEPTQYPIDRGVLCLNVATLFAIAQAVVLGQPLEQRLVTVNGDTRWVALGTPLSDLVSSAEPTSSYRVGGHYTGRLQDPQTKVTAATNAVWTLEPVATTPCTYCARCADRCPEDLAPQVLLRLSQDQRTQAATEILQQGLWSCTECGLCNNQCPSNIDLLSHFQQAKADAKARLTKARLAARAQQRHERHLVRMQARAEAAQQRRESRREARQQRQRGPDAWR